MGYSRCSRLVVIPKYPLTPERIVRLGTSSDALQRNRTCRLQPTQSVSPHSMYDTLSLLFWFSSPGLIIYRVFLNVFFFLAVDLVLIGKKPSL